jgi:hypothetical protein
MQLCGVSYYHGDEYEDGCLLGWNTVVWYILTDASEEITVSVVCV